jgi:hypothetical protein
MAINKLGRQNLLLIIVHKLGRQNLLSIIALWSFSVDAMFIIFWILMSFVMFWSNTIDILLQMSYTIDLLDLIFEQ